jgi:poly-gamma-glutamate synthesis protein (capsule biosynthesis protein)
MIPTVPKHHYILAGALLLLVAGFAIMSLYMRRGVSAEVSHLVPAITPSVEATTTPLRILLVGDMFFDRFIRYQMSTEGSDYPFACIDPLFKSVDFVVGNLEGPITSNNSISLGSIPGSAHNYVFTFATTTAEVLARHNVRAVSLGNNHILNFGRDGMAQTHTYLDQAGVGYFGGVAGDEPIYRVEHGARLSFIAYNQFGGASADEVAERIREEAQLGRMVIVFSHWGTEYSTSVEDTRPAALLFAESGASAIIGSHPHVVGQHEMLGDVPVYYSLGNFIFDQYFSSATQHGLALLLTIDTNKSISIQEYPVELERTGQTCLTTN